MTAGEEVFLRPWYNTFLREIQSAKVWIGVKSSCSFECDAVEVHADRGEQHWSCQYQCRQRESCPDGDGGSMKPLNVHLASVWLLFFWNRIP